MEQSRLKVLLAVESTCVVKRGVCICKELYADAVLSGGTDISFQIFMKCGVCICKELYADAVLTGGTATSFQIFMKGDADIRKRLYAECRVVGGKVSYVNDVSSSGPSCSMESASAG